MFRIGPISRIDRSRDRLRCRNRDVRRAARVPELGEHVGSLGVNGVCDAVPAGHMFVGVETGGVRRDRCGFREN